MAGPGTHGMAREAETGDGVNLSASLEGALLVLASHNPGKLREIAELFRDLPVAIRSAGEIGLPEPEETGASFVENALLKARAARAALIESPAARAALIESHTAQAAQIRDHAAENHAPKAVLATIADDSGLVVPALGGAPGILSARWAGPGKDFTLAMRRVHEELIAAGYSGGAGSVPAHFVCVLAVCWEDGQTRVFKGRAEGTLVWPPRGGRGFGYDPIFLPAKYRETFGEMDPAEKHRISHRAKAFETLVATCFGQI